MPLKGVKVIEFAGLAPAPFCGKILSDYGAKVIRVDKTRSRIDLDRLSNGKSSIAVDLKKEEGINVVRKLCSSADVLIEPFRAGVMEKLGLGPKTLMETNPRLIYARLTGFGQNGPWARKAGHDINYIAISGLLSQLGRKNERPFAPINLMADFAGGGMLCALGIVMALFERHSSGKGQVIDANMVEGSAYVGSWLWHSRDLPIWSKPRGENVLDGGAAYYDTYKTKDGKYVAVGAIEPQFFADLLTGLGIDPDTVSQLNNQDQLQEQFKKIFLTKSQEEWCEVFKDLDACFSPVLEYSEAHKHAHNAFNKSFMFNKDLNMHVPVPAPRLERTPACDSVLPRPIVGENSVDVLKEAGFKKDQIEELLKSGIVESCDKSKL